MKGLIVKGIPAGVSLKLARQVLQLKKNSPALMFGVGVTGAVASTVLACRATLRFNDLLTDAEEQKQKLTLGVGQPMKNDKTYTEVDLAHDLKVLRVQSAIKVAKLYAPAVGVGLVSVGLLTGSHVTLTRRNAGITAAYAVLDKGFKEYRDRVREELGEEKEREFRYGVETREIVEEGEHGHEVKTVRQIGANKYSIYARPFEKTNSNWSNYPNDNRNFIMHIQNWMNDKLRANGHVFLNDVYRALGFPDTQEGAVVGWVKGGKDKYGKKVGDDYIDFGLSSNDPRVDFFMSGSEKSIWLDFNTDGMIYDLI